MWRKHDVFNVHSSLFSGDLYCMLRRSSFRQSGIDWCGHIWRKSIAVIPTICAVTAQTPRLALRKLFGKTSYIKTSGLMTRDVTVYVYLVEHKQFTYVNKSKSSSHTTYFEEKDDNVSIQNFIWTWCKVFKISKVCLRVSLGQFTEERSIDFR